MESLTGDTVTATISSCGNAKFEDCGTGATGDNSNVCTATSTNGEFAFTDMFIKDDGTRACVITFNVGESVTVAQNNIELHAAQLSHSSIDTLPVLKAGEKFSTTGLNECHNQPLAVLSWCV